MDDASAGAADRGRRTLGVVEIVDPVHTTAFTDDEIRFCEALAATGAGALRQAHLYERVRRLADQDALTGLANPRTFQRRPAAGLRVAARSGEQVTSSSSTSTTSNS